MCGLSGIARIGAGALLTGVDHGALRRMVEALAHRGPDESNVEDRGQAGLGFTRLSLVGVSDGNQPFHSADHSVALMANGEVYNHLELAASRTEWRGRTRSDCEVLTPLYEANGPEFLVGVRGILAVAIHDARRRRVVLAVDPFANKPMFYTIVQNLLVFASEIKALFEHPEVQAEVDWSGALIDQGFALYPATTTAPVNTWFQGVRKVAGGTVVTIDLTTGTESVHSYWQPDFEPDQNDLIRSPEEYVEAYRERFVQSVQDSLMSEVGLGLFLSGGVDSSAVAAVASRLGSPLTTFTVATEATVINGDVAASLDVARDLGLENTLLRLESDNLPSVEDWKRLVWLMESPLAGPEHYYKFSLHRAAKQVRPGIKAMLLGTGADEFNGGYTELLSSGLGWYAFESNVGQLTDARLPESLRWWRQAPQEALLRPDALPGAFTSDPYRDYVLLKYRDVQQYNCWLEDRSAAGNGIEARVPFLDSALVDLSTRLPRSLRPRLLWDKAMARAALSTFLPDRIAYREKKPFFDGVTARYAHQTVMSMLQQDHGALVEEALEGPAMAEFVDGDALRAAVREPQAYPLHPEILLRLVNLGLLDIAARASLRPFSASQVRLLGEHRLSEPGKAAETSLLHAFDHLQPGPDVVLAMAEGVDLAQRASDPDEWLLLQGHTMRYVLSQREAPGWVELLRNLDGRSSLKDLCERLDISWEPFTTYLSLCLEQGLLETVAPQHSQGPA